MKVLSFDVGIRHLAYCCIEYDEIDTGSVKNILEWGNINVIPEPEHCYIASCKKPAIQTCTYQDKNICWCDKHSKYYETLQKLTADNLTALSKPSNIKMINCNSISTSELRVAIITNLDKIILPLVHKHNINVALIENQPSMKNPKMKQVMDTIYCWFLIRCVTDSPIIKCEDIHLVNPSNKLKQYVEQLNKCDDATKYKTTKNLSITVVSDYINTNNLDTLREHLDKFIKKDDLCDALLQGFYWIDKTINDNNIIETKKAKKIKKTTEKVEKNKKNKINC